MAWPVAEMEAASECGRDRGRRVRECRVVLVKDRGPHEAYRRHDDEPAQPFQAELACGSCPQFLGRRHLVHASSWGNVRRGGTAEPT